MSSFMNSLMPSAIGCARPRMWIFLPFSQAGTCLLVLEKVMLPVRFGPMRS